MDIQLDGGVSGIAAAAAIRGHLDILVVFLTAHASAETVGRTVESGALGYLLKPYTVPELKAAIDIALHKHTTEMAMRRAQFTIAGRYGASVYLNSPTAGIDSAKGALQNCATKADFFEQVGIATAQRAFHQ